MEELRQFSQLTKYMGKQEVYYNINISLKNSYVYCETAKAACTTIKRTLMNLELEETNFRPEKVHLDFLSTPFVKLFQIQFSEFIEILQNNEFYKFSFVRNPYTRILSCYLDKIVGNKIQKKIILKIMGMDENNLDVNIGFEQFVDAISQQTPKEMNQHWRIQYHSLFGGLIHFDFIGRVENFNEDLQVIDRRLDGKILRNHENVFWHATKSNQKIAEFYTERIAEKVARVYAVDFEKYGYSTNLSSLY